MAKIFNFSVGQNGDLKGNFEEVLNYLSWVINTRANRYFNSQQKGTEFYEAIKTLKERFGMEVSTHFLNQLVDKTKVRNVNKHIAHLLCLGGFVEQKTEEELKREQELGVGNGSKKRYMLNPVGVMFKGYKSLIDGTQVFSYKKTFDFLVFPHEWESKKAQAQAFKEKCLTEWEEFRQMIEREKIEENKLMIASALEETPISYDELENVSPHLVKKDLRLMPKYKSKRGYH